MTHPHFHTVDVLMRSDEDFTRYSGGYRFRCVYRTTVASFTTDAGRAAFVAKLGATALEYVSMLDALDKTPETGMRVHPNCYRYDIDGVGFLLIWTNDNGLGSDGIEYYLELPAPKSGITGSSRTAMQYVEL